MLRSKALKRNYFGKKREEPKTKLQKTLRFISDAFKTYIYWPVEHNYRVYSERISRSFAFARIGWLNYDFDSGFLYDLMSFKLKRIQKVLLDGHAIQENNDMDALKEAIKICDRLRECNYEDKYLRQHDKKWGGIRSKHIPNYDENGKHTTTTWQTSRAKAKTPKQKTKERNEFRVCWESGEADRLADLTRLFEIFKNHERTWWD